MTTSAGSHVKPLVDIEAREVARFGGKSVNCARLLRAGFAVPDGLAIAAEADDADLDRVIAHPWFAAHVGCRFAVRSSGVDEDTPGHSFAGVHETFLHIDRERIADTVRACRRSGASDQATAYRAARGLDAPDARSDRGVGVLIQPMVDALVSGVAFTIHPVTGEHEVVINATRGLGDDLVSGRITPEHFAVSRRDGSTLDSASSSPPHAGGGGRSARLHGSTAARENLADEPALLPDQRRELAALAVKVEALFGSPQDVEWCRDAHQFWILQSRPITTITSTSASPYRVDVEWTRANMAEVFPDLMSPQATAAYEELLNRGQRLHMGGLVAPEDEFGPPFRSFGGRLYFNLTQLKRIARLGGAPASSVLRSLGHADAITPADEVPVRPPIGEILRHLPDFVKLAVRDLRAPALVRQLDRDNAQSVAELTSVDPRSLDDRAFWQTIEHWREAGPERMIVVLVLGGVLFLEESIRKACRSIGQDYEAFVYPQLAAGEPSVSTAQAFDLVELADLARDEPVTSRYLTTATSPVDGPSGPPAGRSGARAALADVRQAPAGTRFLAAFDRFLERYGHRGHYESDWALPRYREDPSPLLFAIRTHLETSRAENRRAIAERLDREARRAWAAFDARLTWWQRLVLRPRVRSMVMRLKERYRLREYCRSELIRVLYHVRQWHLVMADRFVERGWIDDRDDYFLLHTGDIAAVVRGEAPAAGLRDLVATRARERAAQRGLSMPLLMRQSQVDAILAGLRADESPDAPADRRGGLCVSRGLVEAEVVVILDPREFRLMKRGAILVATATDPSWTPLFTLASGVIVEVGGILSHASTVAREYGLPALANVKDATTWLSTGDRVRLDASGGYVARL